MEVLFEWNNFVRILQGMGVTLEIALIAIVISCPLGAILGFFMTLRCSSIRFLCRLYLETIRIIPLLAWLFIFYFGIPQVFRVHISGEIASILVFSLWGIAEIGDLVRGAITSLPPHQRESGRALGLNTIQIELFIIAPQALKRLIPQLINLFTRMIKTTSLVALIGVVEMLKVGQQIIEVNILDVPNASFYVYGGIFIFYFLLCYPLGFFATKLEKRLV